MSRRSIFKPGNHKYIVELDADLNLDLHAFCGLHYSATKAEVTRQALKLMIESAISTNAGI